jgi:site-specific DNA-methyltransferase (adenine-specific)
LRLGDCIEGMRTLHDQQIDVVIADPPYELESHTKGRRTRAESTGAVNDGYDRAIVEKPLPFAPITSDQRTESAWHMARVAKRWVLVFCQVEAAHLWAAALTCAPFGLEYVRTMVWVKPDGQPQLTGDRPGMGYESIVVAHRKGRKHWNGGGKLGVFEYSKNARPETHTPSPHPTTKPQPLMRELVSLFSDEGETILDPFAGSGSTGVAAVGLTRSFLGFELNRDYFDIACRRLRGEEAKPTIHQPGLFDAVR